MGRLLLYIIGGLFALCGASLWYVEGYSSTYLAYILWGLSPFVLRGFVILSEFSPRRRLTVWLRIIRWVILNPIVWFLTSVIANSIPNDSLFMISVCLMLTTPFIQLIWWIVSIMYRRHTDAEINRKKTHVKNDSKTQTESMQVEIKSADISQEQPSYLYPDPYYSSSLAKAEVERLRAELDMYKSNPNKNYSSHADSGYISPFAQAEIGRLKTEAEHLRSELKIYRSSSDINHRALCKKFAESREQYAILKNEHDALCDNYNKVIRHSGKDTESEKEVERLRDENSRLRADIQAISSARDALSTKLEEYEFGKTARHSLSVADLIQRFKDHPTDFEKYVAEIFRRLGYETQVTPRTNDGGIDIRMQKDGISYCVEVKLYADVNTVGREQIQKLYAAQIDSRIDRSIFVTTSSYTQPAIDFAYRNGIALIDGARLLKLITEACS